MINLERRRFQQCADFIYFNIGSEEIVKQFEEGKIPESKSLMQIMSNSGRFRPEFLARITEIIPFAPITESEEFLIFS
jgi:ATP-dependent Clp protease ATP-binding subunit ClpA